MASRGHKLNLQDALLDTPKVHSHLSQCEDALAPFRDYVTLLRDTFQACHLHQEKVGEGTRALANLLSSIDSEIGEKTASLSSNAFAQLARYQTELHSCQEMFNSQLQNSVVNRVSALLEDDMDSIQSLRQAYDTSRLEHEHAVAKFSRTSKRRDSEKARFEANAELYVARKKFYQCTLDYCSQLNEFQMRKKVTLLEPVLTFMHAQMGYFKACHEITNIGFQQLLTNLQSDIQSYHRDYETEARELHQQKTELELQLPSLCIPDPDISDPFTEFPTANTGITSKYGYLYLRVQKSGLAAKWERTFFFTKNGYLYTQSFQKSAEALLHLKESEAFPSDCDDRRYVLQISHHALKKPVFLQAENDVQRAEWISVINNNSVRKTQHGATVGGQGSDASRLRTRLYDSLERERIRTWATRELNQEISGSPSSSVSSTTTKTSSGLKITTPPSRRPRSPLRSALKSLTSNGSRESKSPQRSLGGLLGRSRKQSTPVPSLPSSSSETFPPERSVGSKMADVESWVDSTTGATAGAPPPRPLHPPQSTSAGVSIKFAVKYLGQKEVQDPKNSSAISGTIRGVMTARAVKKVKPATSIELAIHLKKITLTEVQSNKAVGGFQLKSILNCAAHPEDDKLFAVVCRSPNEPDRSKFICHVMQADQSGTQVCMAISNAIQTLWKMMQGKSDVGRRSSTDSKSQGPPDRPPPPYTSLLGSYSPAPAGLAVQHQRTHTSPAALHTTPISGGQHRPSSESNLPGMAPRPDGSGLREEVGVAGRGTMPSMSLLPPSLPESSSTSAEYLGRQDGGTEDIRPVSADSSLLMFSDILEETEEVPLISFDQSTLRTTLNDTAATTAALADGYVAGDGGESPIPSTPTPSPTPAPPPVTTASGTQLTLPPRTRPSSSSPPPTLQPLPPHLSTPSQLTPSLTSQIMEAHTTSSKPSKQSDSMALKPSTTHNKTINSEMGQTTSAAPALSAADSLAKALGFEPIPPPPTAGNGQDTTTGGTTAAVTSSTTTDPLAEAFGFDTTPEDIENLIELMSPSDSDMIPSEPTRATGTASGYTTSNPAQSEQTSNYV